jgi:predicted transcriptional regulator
MQDKLETLEDMIEFIRHFLMKDGYLVRKNEVYYTLVQKIGNQNILEYLKELRNFSNFYAKLLKPEEELNKDISNRLKSLNRIEVTTACPFLLNIF